MWRFVGWVVVGAVLLSGREPAALPEFVRPVEGLMQLTGTFGELRGNHFHAGLDIRGPVGRPVVAVADGYVARVVVKGGGYGQALYLHHPSGHTSVYGHLEDFREDIATFIKRRQYDQETFALDLELSPERFPVKKGDLIGYIGQRGHAFGPHLHFELRDRATQDPLNPMSFGITVPDNQAPFVEALRLYELDERGNTIRARNLGVRRLRAGDYSAESDTLFVAAASLGLAVKAYDKQDGLANWNGIYALEMYRDDSLHFAFAFERYDGDQTRYLNAHLDYEEQQARNSWFHRAFRLPGNRLGIYESTEEGGRLALAPGAAARIRFVVKDKAGNACTVRTVVKRKPGAAQPEHERTYTYRLPYDEESIIDNGSVRVRFPEESFYQDLHLHYDLVVEASEGLYSPVHQLHDHLSPVHRPFDIQIRPNEIPPPLREKTLVAYCKDGHSPLSYGGSWTRDNRLRARVRSLGNYCIMADTIAPTISPERWQADMRGWEQFSFRVKDNFPTTGQARDLRFRAEVDGMWILLEYDEKNRRLFHEFDGIIPSGEHQLKLTVTDDRDNTAVWEGTFRR